ncbi:unnamed protein product [Effrenium voratum]|nr:unnamed protein product [Effrenium voratum]
MKGEDAEEKDLEILDNLKFSRNAGENPMHNWNHVYVRYCDGAYYSGSREEPKNVSGLPLYFRGRYITMALFADLQNRGMSNATDVVLSGCSAGAIHIFAHLDAMKEMAPRSAKVVGLPDSGFYMDKQIFTPLKRYVVTEQQATALLNQDCVKQYDGAEEKCLVGNVVAAYLQTPTFALQSRYDDDQHQCEMDEACRNSNECIQEYAANMTKAMQTYLTYPHGYFLDSCSRHCSFNERPVDPQSGLSQLEAFGAWYAGSNATYTQEPHFPCPQCCHGTGTFSAQISFTTTSQPSSSTLISLVYAFNMAHQGVLI